MAVTSRHNKYTSIPDWFSGQSTETATTSSSVSQTVYISGSSGSTTTDSTVDFKDIPIDNLTIVWLNEQLTVPIDNDKIIIVDGKVTTSANANGVWELRQLTDGTNYIYTTYPVVTQLGITMYSGTEGLDIGGIYDGLPIDNTTIYWDIDSNGNKVLKAIGSSSGGGVADSVTWANVVGKPMWLLDDKISYSEIEGTPDLSKYALVSLIPSLEGYALSSDLAKYIPIAGVTDITGEKNFIGGLKVNGSPIYYDEEKKYWKLEGDLLVTGGVTMYGNDSDFVASTIMDAILYDDSTLGINAQGQLYVKGSVGGATTLGSLANIGSWADSVASQDRIMYQAANSSQWVAKNLSDLAIGGVTGDYLPLTGGELSGSLAVIAIQNGYWAGGIRIDGTTSKYPSVGFHIANVAGSRLYVNESFELIFEWSTYNPVASHKVIHSGNYYNYALPLSGGTLTGSYSLLALNSTHENGSVLRFYINDTYKGEIGWYKDHGVGIYNGASKKDLYLNDSGSITYGDNTIWHSGNDGSGSGLDADLLDGYDSSYIMKYGGNWTASTDTAGIFAFGFGGSSAGLANNYGAGIQLCNAQGVNAKPSSNNSNSNWYSQLLFGTDNRVYARFNTNGGGWSGQNKIAYVTDNVASATRVQAYTHDRGEKLIISGSRSDNTFPRKIYDNGVGLVISQTESNGTVHNGYIASINSNVASATKLQTPRTIWGQSFDGTANVIGTAHIGQNTNGTATIDAFGGNAYYGCDAVVNGSIISTTGAYIAINGKNGNVGIGTTSPGAKLHVVGDVNVAKPSTAKQASLSFMNTSSDLWQISGRFNKNNSAENDRLNFYYYNGTTWSNIMTLYNNGNMFVSGGITMYSARKLKNITDERGLSLDELSVIKPTRFTWKDGRDDKVHIGGIADDVMKVLPEVIYKTGEDDTLTMDYGNAAFAIAASLIKPVVNHEERIRLLEEENKRLKEEVEQLKWNIA